MTSLPAAARLAFGETARVKWYNGPYHEDKEPFDAFVVEVFHVGELVMELHRAPIRSRKQRRPVLRAVAAALAAGADGAAPSEPEGWAPGRDWIGRPSLVLGIGVRRVELTSSHLKDDVRFAPAAAPPPGDEGWFTVLHTDADYIRFWCARDTARRIALAYVRARKGDAWIERAKARRARLDEAERRRIEERAAWERAHPEEAARQRQAMHWLFSGLFERDVQ